MTEVDYISKNLMLSQLQQLIVHTLKSIKDQMKYQNMNLNNQLSLYCY